MSGEYRSNRLFDVGAPTSDEIREERAGREQLTFGLNDRPEPETGEAFVAAVIDLLGIDT